ncbi:jun dimerization protein 2 [Triplophysa rosa]|uniref:Jun dimerization protein 2 n=1 Tax=Triplophysa rosa TaxID=992332 RepID=A0A9W7WIF8_TRIRA|nr:jun dimerization protein 2 [Triplophysa rosa]
MQHEPTNELNGRTDANPERTTIMMPGQIPDPTVTAGSLPSIGPLAGISATTLTDQLKLAELYSLGAVLSPLILNRHGKRPLSIIKSETDDDDDDDNDDRKKRRREKNKVAAARCRNRKKERTDFLQKVSRIKYYNKI